MRAAIATVDSVGPSCCATWGHPRDLIEAASSQAQLAGAFDRAVLEVTLSLR